MRHSFACVYERTRTHLYMSNTLGKELRFAVLHNQARAHARVHLCVDVRFIETGIYVRTDAEYWTCVLLCVHISFHCALVKPCV